MNGVALVTAWVAYFCGRGPSSQDILNGENIDAGIDTWQNRLAEVMANAETFAHLGDLPQEWVLRCFEYLTGRQPTLAELNAYAAGLPPYVTDYTFMQYKLAAERMIADSFYSPLYPPPTPVERKQP